MTKIKVQIKTLPHYEGLPLPVYGTEQSAGMDLHAAIDAPISLQPLQREAIPTGLAMAIPDGYELQIRGRSGLAKKNGIGMVNGIGTIDADYRGEISAIIINLSNETFIVERGMRIAQCVLNKFEKIEWDAVTELDETARGAGGFGSTGTKVA
ncbi:MAG: Deoxyuridine 5-triphosphate nucleotidohydrolase [Alphaproteobacteria bacterium]|nr:Deoxyuridine 5-triphosphate nucleotidohydrolase [Alphaproteobacteria bacterium]